MLLSLSLHRHRRCFNASQIFISRSYSQESHGWTKSNHVTRNAIEINCSELFFLHCLHKPNAFSSCLTVSSCFLPFDLFLGMSPCVHWSRDIHPFDARMAISLHRNILFRSSKALSRRDSLPLDLRDNRSLSSLLISWLLRRWRQRWEFRSRCWWFSVRNEWLMQ